jgi:hypothetical protein
VFAFRPDAVAVFCGNAGAGDHAYVYDNVPPEAIAVIEPLKFPLHKGSTELAILNPIGVGCVTVEEAIETHPAPSVTVTK